jgi:hypothetical protein
MAGRLNRPSGDGAGTADRQGSAPGCLGAGPAASAGSGCTTLNAGFTLGFVRNLFISQPHNPAASVLFQKSGGKPFPPTSDAMGICHVKNAMTADDIRPTVA